MALEKFADRIHCVTTTTGQGTITVGAPISNAFFPLTDSGLADGDQVTIVLQEGNDVEVSTGVIGGTLTTITRATVHESRIAGVTGTSKLELAGGATVLITSPAWWLNAIEGRAGFLRKLPEIAPKTADYTITAADAGVPLIANKATAITFNLPALAGALQEAYFVRNIGVGTLTLDGNAAETIEGNATLAITTGMAAIVWPNNSNGSWRAQIIGPTATEIAGATAKTTPADADKFGIADSAASNILKFVTWANIKTLLLWESIVNAASAKTTPVDADLFSIADSAAAGVIKKLTWANLKATLLAYLNPFYGKDVVCGRLTLTTGVPVTTSDVLAATTLYFTPYKGNQIGLYNGSWLSRTFTELSISLAGLTAGKPYDVFVYDAAGSQFLELVVWTNDTTRATAIAYQDGVPCKTGSLDRRLVGTIYTSATGQCEDSRAKRYVGNLYNVGRRDMSVMEAANTWNYTLATIRQANGSTANQLDYVSCMGEDAVDADITAASSNSTISIVSAVMVGVDSTTARAAEATCQLNYSGAQATVLRSTYRGNPGLGRHRLTWLEYSQASGTTVWYGDNNTPLTLQSGIVGSCYG